ncbi:hypothetical protein [Staphylococcus kloosii]|uniref:Uncharacterized protein n=1 Tax=Staphylococcus kloosii TaxID=29384 RepID=A0A151A3G3_9STAP|nr:hypothetical protein [Staphylococcus kloosii]KYH13968.1 hypothetical protein A0131_04015 [Staphylococcus kloosii]MCD8879208.1 hypothetical protein [Staphylococcus kloosii]
MDIFIAISALVYGLLFSACFLYLKSGASETSLSEGKRETVWTYMLAVTSVLLVIFAVISIADIFGWVKNGQPLLLFGIAMLQLCSLENDYYKFKTRLFYLLIGLVILVGNLLIVIL